MTELQNKSFQEIAAECEAIIADLEDDLDTQKRWQEVLTNARSNPSVPDLQAKA
jgi:hypothetical protein